MATKVGGIGITNFKKINALDIPVNGGNVFIMGKNQTGKTTLIQALYCVLTGKELPPDPLTHGTHKGQIQVQLVDSYTKELKYTAALTFSEKNPKGKLTVTTPDGRDVPGGPRTLLDTLTQNILFDPFDFIRKTPKEQVKEFKRMFGFNFDAQDKEYAEIWERRAEINKEIKHLKSAIETSTLKEYELNMFVKEKDIEELREQIRQASETNKKIQEASIKESVIQNKIVQYSDAIEKIVGEATAINELLESLKTTQDYFNSLKASLHNAMSASNSNNLYQLKSAIDVVLNSEAVLTTELQNLEKRVEEGTKTIDPLKEELKTIQELSKKPPIDVSKLTELYQDSIIYNEKVKQVTEHKAKLMEIEEKEMFSKQYSEQLKDIQKEKLRIIAEKNIRVPGLTFDAENDCLLLDGLAFDETQISKSKIIATGIELMMATNPELRICRIKDGSLLDKETRAELLNIINEQDFQAFVELVQDDVEELKLEIQEVD